MSNSDQTPDRARTSAAGADQAVPLGDTAKADTEKQIEKVKADNEKPIEKIKVEDEKLFKAELEKQQLKPEKDKFEKGHKLEKLEKEKPEKEKLEKEQKSEKLEKEKHDKLEFKEHKVEKFEHKQEKLEFEKDTAETPSRPATSRPSEAAIRRHWLVRSSGSVYVAKVAGCPICRVAYHLKLAPNGDVTAWRSIPAQSFPTTSTTPASPWPTSSPNTSISPRTHRTGPSGPPVGSP